MNHEATAKVMKKKSMGKKGKAMSVEFSPLKGAAMKSNTRYASHEDPDSPYGGSSEEMAHPTMAHAVKHMKACMGTGSPEEEAAEGE